MSEEIVCPSCGFANETARVFCHQCGVRLPRTMSQMADVAKTNDQSKEKEKSILKGQVEKTTKVSFDFSGLLASVIASVIKLVPIAAVIAAGILVFRLPDGLPPVANKKSPQSLMMEALIQAAESGDYQGKVSYTETQINDYLAKVVQLEGKEISLLGQLRFDRTFVQLGENVFQIGLEFDVAGQHFVLRSEFQPVLISNHYALELRSSSIGCLLIPSVVIQSFFAWYQPVSQALQPQLKTLSQAQSIRISPKAVEVSWVAHPALKKP